MNGIVLRVPTLKTAVVRVERTYVHPIYKKRIKVSKNIMVHDEFDSQVGDKVTIIATKPISKRKKHAIKEKL